MSKSNTSPAKVFSIERTGLFKRKRRLVATAKLTPADFAAIAAALGKAPMRARKTALISARQAGTRREVVTDWKGELTRNVAEAGDWIATSLTADGKVMRDKDGKENSYVILQARFGELYERAAGETEFGLNFQSKSIVEALHFTGGLDIVAPWGERQTAADAYLLSNGQDVYGNERTTFDATYKLVR